MFLVQKFFCNKKQSENKQYSLLNFNIFSLYPGYIKYLTVVSFVKKTSNIYMDCFRIISKQRSMLLLLYGNYVNLENIVPIV